MQHKNVSLRNYALVAASLYLNVVSFCAGVNCLYNGSREAFRILNVTASLSPHSYLNICKFILKYFICNFAEFLKYVTTHLTYSCVK